MARRASQAQLRPIPPDVWDHLIEERLRVNRDLLERLAKK